jgi:mandelate racemase
MPSSTAHATPDTLASITARPVLVPMRRPLKTGSGEVARVPLVLVDLAAASGVVGRAYLFAIAPWALRPLAELVRGLFGLVAGEALAPARLAQTLRRKMTLPGIHGLAGMALAGIDMAAWDAAAKAAGLPLARLLGGAVAPVRAYNSNGLGLMAADAAAKEAVELVEEGGFSAVKIRLGRPDARADLAAVRAVRRALPDGVLLMSDFNQALTRAEALHRGRMLDGEGLAWIEEPVRADDLAAAAELARSLATPIQLGENFGTIFQMEEALRLGAADLVMPDIQRIGGVTAWLHAAGLAAAAGVPMSTHLFPEFSAQVMTVTPTAHWLEYVDWAAPILATPYRVEAGHVVIPETPGVGLEWDEAAVAKYAA